MLPPGTEVLLEPVNQSCFQNLLFPTYFGEAGAFEEKLILTEGNRIHKLGNTFARRLEVHEYRRFGVDCYRGVALNDITDEVLPEPGFLQGSHLWSRVDDPRAADNAAIGECYLHVIRSLGDSFRA